jgi:group I intron endonuclease
MNDWWKNYELTPRRNDLKNCPGVYCLICKATGQVYVGSGQDVSHRIRQHFNLLVKRKHYNHAMQIAWNLYGHSAFDWQILLELPIEVNQADRFVHEERFMRGYASELLFNIMYPATNERISKRK